MAPLGRRDHGRDHVRPAARRAAARPNRLTFGRWDQPYDLLASLGQRLEASADVDRLLERVVEELHSLGLGDVGILAPDGALVAGSPRVPQAQEIKLTAYGRRVGTLLFTAPPVRLRERDRQLLDDLAGHLGGVLHAHALTAELRRSRERLVLAREEERRRLRRDLHDGLGPSLAGHLLRLDLVATQLPRGSRPRADVESLRAELAATMSDVRRVVEGLRPPAIDELGLAGAVQQVVTRLAVGAGLDLRLDLAVPAQLPAAVEVAAFRIITEAVTNVVRHAEARHCLVRVHRSGVRLLVEVVDDGSGDGPLDGARGHGLSTMRERAEELGGSLHLRRGLGTTVHAELPLPPVPVQAAAVPTPSPAAEAVG